MSKSAKSEKLVPTSSVKFGPLLIVKLGLGWGSSANVNYSKVLCQHLYPFQV